MNRFAAEAGRPAPGVAVIPYVSPAKTVEEGAKHFNMAELCNAMTKSYMPPPSGASG